VAEELELERTALYRALAPMIRDGWIVTSDTRPGNVKTAKITKKGRKLLTSVGRDWDGVQSELVKKFGAREFDALVGELYRLASCAETLNAQ
jgi:DNA-binding PadR family transcriptional regulator